ncbi:hypothetical protein BJ508DRAFT_330070 [Ascobolus immersus RN42]|uniref:Uncharacterized protein n=1 Tax=Ascobolus immersus RN42 TaxID=1160509 RepID=A0A3N4HUW0_ASCIM|nr:hypothetical protein BJ508DRAFT_330070 [Ascobolus immersus RN42]
MFHRLSDVFGLTGNKRRKKGEELEEYEISDDHQKLSNQVKLRPYIHVLLHVAWTCEMYGNLHNVSCSAGETCHKPFRDHARKTNHINVSKTLMTRNDDLQRIRQVLEGAYSDTHKGVTDTLQGIAATIPTLFSGHCQPSPVPSLVKPQSGEPRAGQNLSDMTAVGAFKDHRLFRVMRGKAAKFKLPKYNEWIRVGHDFHIPIGEWLEKWNKVITKSSLGAIQARYYCSVTIVRPYYDRPDKRITYNINKLYEINGGSVFCPRAFMKISPDGRWHDSYVFALVSPTIPVRQSDRVLGNVKSFQVNDDSFAIMPLFFLLDPNRAFIRYKAIDDTDGDIDMEGDDTPVTTEKADVMDMACGDRCGLVLVVC